MDSNVKPGKLKRLNLSLGIEEPFFMKIKEEVAKSFDLYFDKCAGSDAIRPDSLICINTYGISASLFESLELLLILDLKSQYKKAVRWIKENFNCSNIGWVNRREFWNRGIASMIGTYLLTEDNLFIDIAQKCANAAISIDEKFDYRSPYINLKTQESRARRWQNGTALVDIVVGLPELISLYKITKNDIFSIAYLSIINNIPFDAGYPIRNYYFLKNKKPACNYTKFDSTLIGFYTILTTAHLIKPMKSTEVFLNKTLNNITFDIENENYFELFPLLDAIKLLNSSSLMINIKGFDEMYQKAKQSHLPPYKLYSLETKNKLTSFRFDASILRSIQRENFMKDDKSINQFVINFFNHSMKYLKNKEGYSGLTVTSNQNLMTSDIQESSLFGEWFKVAALYINGSRDLVTNAVFNEKGHLLHSHLIQGKDNDED